MLGVVPQVFESLPDQHELVVFVEDGKIAADLQMVSFSAQEASSPGVEGAQGGRLPGWLALGRQKLLHVCQHFARRLVGEGHSQHVLWRGAERVDGIGDAVGQDACLAGAGAGEYQHRAGWCADRLTLRRVQPVEQGRLRHTRICGWTG